MRVRRSTGPGLAALLLAFYVAAGGSPGNMASAQNKPGVDAADKGGPRIGLSASLFATDPAGQVNNVSLMWATTDASDRYEVQRSAKEAGPFENVYSGTGTSYKDYALKDGSYFYRLNAVQKGKRVTSAVASVSTMPMPASLKKYSNTLPNRDGLPGDGLKIGDTFYEFPFQREGTAMKLRMRTSTDEKNWKEGPIVMDPSSHPDLADCKFEAVDTFYDAAHDRIVYWCHWEKSRGYGDGRALVATAQPGERFTVHHIYNPLGVEVRDMSLFVDDDKTGYLVAASNLPGQGANATLYIFKLNKTYDDVVEIVAKVVENGYREAPHIVKRDGFYYLFFSQAAGWFPSQGGYVSARSISGPWGAPRTIGSPSTFSSQSGGVLKYGFDRTHAPVMMGNRWVRGEGTNNQVALPIQLAEGFAFYDYAPILLHDPSKNVIIPLDLGKLLSQDRPAKASIAGKPGNEVSKAFDGNYFSSFQSDDKKWPFELTTDLGKLSNVRNVQISWFLHKGSEAFYTYSIEGSRDGQKWSVLLDRTDKSDRVLSKTYGFTSDELPADTQARYVKVKIQKAHLHNNPNNWYPPTVYEIKVFGEQR